MSLKFADLTPNRAALEIRYPSTYTLWDRAGQIWAAVENEWGELNNVEVAPNQQVFYANDQFELKITLDRANLIEHRPKSSLDDFAEKAEKFTNIITTALELREFSRVGFRVFLSKEFSDSEAASAALLSVGLINSPQGKLFGIHDRPGKPSLSLRWEGEVYGAVVNLKAQTTKTELSIAPVAAHEIEKVSIDHHDVEYNIDYYTTTPIPTEKIRMRDWIKQAFHIARRDSKKVFGE